MKKLIVILMVGLMIPFCATAQLSKQMAKYHKKAGVSVTQLDKSLYGLYQRENLPAEAKDMLQKLDEVNILNLNTNTCDEGTQEKIIGQFHEILDNPNNYKLVKSRNDNYSEQLIYTRNKNGKVSDLVVWDMNPHQMNIIELRGDIETEKIALLSKALNIQGLHSLATLSPSQRSNESADYSEAMRQAREAMQKFNSNFLDGFGNKFANPFTNPNDTTLQQGSHLDLFNDIDAMVTGMFSGLDPQQLKELMKSGSSHKVEKFVQSFGDPNNVISNSIQITEENGKTKLKIDSKNSDITYIIDGQKMPKDNVQMPEKILNVNIIPSKEDMKKSYLFVTSQDKIGTFTSYKNGILNFKYNNQDYQYNLDKVQEPLLVLDGRLASSFNVEPTEILQIRPISQIEKEVGYYPNAQVIINTK